MKRHSVKSQGTMSPARSFRTCAVRLALAVIVAAITSELGKARAQSNTFQYEALIQSRPVDLEVTPNGLVAVVRGNSANDDPSDQKLSLWDTHALTASQGKIIPMQPSVVGRGNVPMTSGQLPLVSDAIAVTNDRVIAIGSDVTQTKTYVDILSISYASEPPTATVLQTYMLGLTGTGRTAGLAHDVAITPDGALAVVSCRNWVYVFRLSDGILTAQLNIGTYNTGIGSTGFCEPGFSRNSVAVTNTRAVVTAQHWDGVRWRTWVYLINLVPTDPPVPVITLAHDLGIHQSWTNNMETSPHDLAITPNGLRAVVTTKYLVALFDLVTNQMLIHDDPNFRTEPSGGAFPSGGAYKNEAHNRDWNGVGPDLWHSVEVSNTRAVVISSPAYGEPWPNKDYWSLDVFDISSSMLSHKWDYIPPYDSTKLGWPWDDAAWDLDLSEDGQYASVKTDLHDVVLPDVNDPQDTDVRRAGPGADKMNPPSELTPAVGYHYGNSATTILQPVGIPQKEWAAFVGKDNATTTLRFYDVLSNSWQLGSSVVSVRPIHLAVGPGESHSRPDEHDNFLASCPARHHVPAC